MSVLALPSLSGLRPRLVLLAVLPAVLGTLLVAVASSYISAELKEERAEAVLAAGADRAVVELGAVTEGLHTVAAGVALRPDLLAAVASNDTAALRGIGPRIFEALRAADAAISVVEITDATGRVVMRGHNPGQAGDDKSAVRDVAQALRGQVARGVTFSPSSSQFAIGAAVQLRAEGRTIGTLKVAARLNEATAANLARAAGGEVAIYGGDRLVATTLPEAARRALPVGLDAAAGPVSADLPGYGPKLALARPINDMDGRRIGSVVVLHAMDAWAAAAQRAMQASLLVAAAVIAGATLSGLFAANRIADPLAALGEAMGRIARGALDTLIPGRERRDEIGTMARALEVFRDGAAERERLEAAAKAETAARERRAVEIERHTQAFGGAVSGVVAGLADASQRMAGTASSMASAAAQTEARAAETAADAGRSVADLGAVAAATEDLTASVGEIARRAATAAQAARGATRRAEEADGTMQRLTEAAGTIGEVARLIGDIAGQTNLLALNATIEAARAGEAGKGFAVVASEVKTLAGQTAKATEQIAGQIAAIRGVTDEAAEVVRGMAGEVREMGESSSAIAAAVEEQGAATREIASNVARVLETSQRTVAAMTEAREAAASALAASREVEAAAGSVGGETGSLRREVDQFLGAMRDLRSEVA